MTKATTPAALLKDTMPCTNCDGEGSFLYREGQPEDFLLNPRLTCPKCDGKGISRPPNRTP